MLRDFTRGGNRASLKLIDVDVREAFASLSGLEGYEGVIALVWVGDEPAGYVRVPIRRGKCAGSDIRASVLDALSWRLARAALAHPPEVTLTDTATAPSSSDVGLPGITVAVCTRDRPAQLQRCLLALQRLDYHSLDVVIVFSGSGQDQLHRLVRERFPGFRCFVEEQPGLSRARNAAIHYARGDIIAFTDDDCSPHPRWARALARAFARDESVMAVTGLVVPLELESRAQILFEGRGGFGRGFDRRRYQLRSRGSSRETFHLGAGRFGTGANMAFRRSVFASVGDFDLALGVGTPTRGGEDLDMFFRILEEGHALLYDPAAVVRHAHRSDYEALRAQVEGTGIALYAFFTREARAYPKRSLAFARLALRWLWRRNLRGMAHSFVRPGYLPRDLVWVELVASLHGPGAYRRALQMIDPADREKADPLSEVVA